MNPVHGRILTIPAQSSFIVTPKIRFPACVVIPVELVIPLTLDVPCEIFVAVTSSGEVIAIHLYSWIESRWYDLIPKETVTVLLAFALMLLAYKIARPWFCTLSNALEAIW